MRTKHLILRGFFKCPCGKLHSYGGISVRSQCSRCARCLECVMWACAGYPQTCRKGAK